MKERGDSIISAVQDKEESVPLGIGRIVQRTLIEDGLLQEGNKSTALPHTSDSYINCFKCQKVTQVLMCFLGYHVTEALLNYLQGQKTTLRYPPHNSYESFLKCVWGGGGVNNT